MSGFTLRVQPIPDDAERATIESIAAGHGAQVSWVHFPACGRTYGLVERAGDACAAAIREATGAVIFERPIIALAVYPSVPEALPLLLHALGGPGRPDGVLACEAHGAGVIVEWDMDRSALEVVLGLVDIEINRFHARRVNALLTPLPLRWWTAIAASGLHAPEITPDRVLEEALEVHRVLD
ncbi:MAG TPA: hypothetical protein VMF11_11235 [Candidatus Baltobacteraceae bacterium]|nr:hypothetical protein [Candidatus Baltobacteraceae bacterium]